MVTEQSTLEQRPQVPARDAGQATILIDDGPVYDIGPELAASLAPATHVLHEWRPYRVLCRGAVRLGLGSQSYGAIVEGAFNIQFENQVGRSRIRAFDASGTVIATRHVEVISPKLGDAHDSLAFLRAILADLTSERGAIAYMPRAATSRTVQVVNRPPSLLVQYFQLLNNAEAIAEALELIERSPHQVLDDESRHVSIFDVTDIDADVVLQLVQGDAAWDRSATPPRLRAAPGGVWFRVPQEGYDSAENRFVRAVASALGDACDEVLRAPWLRGTDDATDRRREIIARLRSRLRRFERTPMFDEVGPMLRVPVSSRVLQRRAGYRDLNLLWQEFLQSREPVWRRMQHAIDLRDIATLYEYWVWFALCREVQEAFNVDRPLVDAIPPSEPALPHGLRARFPGIGTLTYNASRQAYSGISLRPDYLWEPEDGGKIGFDAKFRLAWDAVPLDVDEGAVSDPQARAKADDLVKMHAYRDAIPGLRAAVVLYPGHVAAFRSASGEKWSGISLADVLQEEMNGVGAIPMRPQSDVEGTG